MARKAFRVVPNQLTMLHVCATTTVVGDGKSSVEVSDSYESMGGISESERNATEVPSISALAELHAVEVADELAGVLAAGSLHGASLHGASLNSAMVQPNGINGADGRVVVVGVARNERLVPEFVFIVGGESPELDASVSVAHVAA